MIDIDGLFEIYFKKYMLKNAGKYTEDQWEDKIPEVYAEFSDTPLKALDGKTPNDYFGGKSSAELVELLKECVKTKSPVSDFLCEAITKSDSEKELLNLLDKSNGEEIISYAVNLLSDIGSVKPFSVYLEYLKDENTPDNLLESMTEKLCDNADLIKEEAIISYGQTEKNRQYFAEIFSNMKKRDDRILDALIKEFADHKGNPSLYAGYLSKYGDEKALPYLYERIKDKNLNYIDYKELKMAIDELGGEWKEERDFSDDFYYNKLKGKIS